MLTLASGFRRAGAEHNPERMRRPVRIFEANEFRKKLRVELTHFLKEIDVRIADEGWIAGKIKAKLEELIEKHRIPAYVKKQSVRLLMNNQAYQASVLLASKKFKVRKRDLETADELP